MHKFIIPQTRVRTNFPHNRDDRATLKRPRATEIPAHRRKLTLLEVINCRIYSSRRGGRETATITPGSRRRIYRCIFMFVTSAEYTRVWRAILTIRPAASREQRQTRLPPASRLISALSVAARVWIYRT